MSSLKFEDDDEIVPTTRAAPKKRSAKEVAEPKGKSETPEKPEGRRRQSEQSKRMPLYIGLGVGGFVVVVAVIVGVALTFSGGTSSASYTDKALRAYINGYAADFHRKGRTPSAKQIAAVEARLKAVKPGTVADFRQGLRILNERRDLEDYTLDTLGTSEYVSSTFFSVFGKPSDTPVKGPFQQTKIWHHRCSDGQVEMLGVMEIENNKAYMKLLPPKKH